MSAMSAAQPQRMDFADREPEMAHDVETLLFGQDPTPRVVAAEFRSPNKVLLYQRAESGETVTAERTFNPWLIARSQEALRHLRPQPASSQLNGIESHSLANLFEFETWDHFRRAVDLLPALPLDICAIWPTMATTG